MTAHASPSPPGLLREPLLAAAGDLRRAGRWELALELLAGQLLYTGVLFSLAPDDDAAALAAQVTLAGALEPGDEWTTLFQAARHTADDLDLTWLRASLRDPA